MTPGTEIEIVHINNTSQATIVLENAAHTLNGVADGSGPVILGVNSVARIRCNAAGEFFIRGNIGELS